MDMMIFRISEIAGQPLVYTRASQCWLMVDGHDWDPPGEKVKINSHPA